MRAKAAGLEHGHVAETVAFLMRFGEREEAQYEHYFQYESRVIVCLFPVLAAPMVTIATIAVRFLPTVGLCLEECLV